MLNRLLKYKKVTMSIPEFCALNRGEITLKQIYLNREATRSLEKVCRRYPKITKVVIFFLATILLVSNTVFASTTDISKVDVSKINTLGQTLLMLVQSIGYWFCIIVAAKEILVSLMQNQAREVGGIILKYILAFGGFYALPWSFDLIRDLLG